MNFKLQSFYEYFRIQLEVVLNDHGEFWDFSYKLAGPDLNKIIGIEPLAEKKVSAGTELWKSTCFEVFLFEDGLNSYHEFNFAKNLWDFMSFKNYREKIENKTTCVEVKSIEIETSNEQIVFHVKFTPPKGNFWISPTVILESKSGQKDYFALAHPQEKPDFHLFEAVKSKSLKITCP